MVMIYARGEASREEVERSVVEMMDRANWWRLVGMGRPHVLPEKISDIDFLMDYHNTGDFRTRLGRSVLWHRIAGLGLRPIAGWSLTGLYYICRMVGAALFLTALIFLWKTLAILASIFGQIIGRAFYLIMLLPQLLMTSVSVSPDSLVLVLSALFFYGAAALLAGQGRARKPMGGKIGGHGQGWYAALIVFPALMGLMTDRSAFFMAVLAVILPFLLMRRENWKSVAIMSLLGVVAAILLAYFAALRFPLETERIVLNGKYVIGRALKALPAMFALDGFTRSYWTFMADGFLLKFGWLVFSPPRIVYYVWRILLALSAAGLGVQAVRWAKLRIGKKYSNETAVGKWNWILLFGIAVFVQAAGIWIFYGAIHYFGQGRYFFPVIVPIAVFMVLGLSAIGNLVKRGTGRSFVAGMILAEFLLFVFSAWHDVVPAFHFILQGPHPGV